MQPSKTSSIKSFNYLKPNVIRLIINDLPNVSFTCQACNFPSIRAGSAEQSNPFIDLPRIGDKLFHEDLRIEFIIQESLENYFEIYDWMISVNFPDNYEQFSALRRERKYRFPYDKQDDSSAYSDIKLSMLDSDNNEKAIFTYKDCFPVYLDEIPFDIRNDNADYHTVSAIFKYSNSNIKII